MLSPSRRQILAAFGTATVLQGARSANPPLALMGGGDDIDDAFRFLIAQSDSGEFLTLRASGSDDYDPYIRKLGGMRSAATLIFRNREMASDPDIVGRIGAASVIFFAGGDQSKYVNYWKGTPVQGAVQHLAAKGVPIGGTSAGLAILGQFVYSSQNVSTTSATALADPFHASITLERDFLRFRQLEGILTDTHFVERDRMGRTLAFLARILAAGWSKHPRALAIDRETAVTVDRGGAAQVVGRRAAYLLEASRQPEACRAGVPLSMRNIRARRLSPGDAIHLPHWASPADQTYDLSVDHGRVGSTLTGNRIY